MSYTGSDTRTVEKFTFDDIFNSSYTPKSYSVDWVGGKYFIVCISIFLFI